VLPVVQHQLCDVSGLLRCICKASVLRDGPVCQTVHALRLMYNKISALLLERQAVANTLALTKAQS
jgi:hypothetical protein